MFPQDRIRVNGGRTPIISAIAVDKIRVAQIKCIFVRGKGYAIGSAESIRNNADVAGTRIKAIDKLRKLRFWPMALLVSIDWVCEPDGTVRVNDHVIWAVEWS